MTRASCSVFFFSSVIISRQLFFNKYLKWCVPVFHLEERGTICDDHMSTHVYQYNERGIWCWRRRARRRTCSLSSFTCTSVPLLMRLPVYRATSAEFPHMLLFDQQGRNDPELFNLEVFLLQLNVLWNSIFLYRMNWVSKWLAVSG